MLEFLPPRLSAALRHVNLNLLYELRVRADKPLVANLGGTFCYVGENGRTTQREAALVPTEKELSDIVFAASGYSVYSVSEQIKQGFLTGAAGERIGIAGSYVCEGDRVLSVHTVTSLCIRVPHAIPGCAERIYTDLYRLPFKRNLFAVADFSSGIRENHVVARSVPSCKFAHAFEYSRMR